MGGAQLTAYHGNGKSGEPPSQSGPGPGTPKIAAIFAVQLRCLQFYGSLCPSVVAACNAISTIGGLAE